MATYTVSVNQAGNHATSIVGDHAQVIANFSPTSSVQDLLTLLRMIRQELERMDIPPDAKDEAKFAVAQAIMQAQKEPPDKPRLVQYLKKTAEIVKDSSTIALGIAKFWTLVRKAIEWTI